MDFGLPEVLKDVYHLNDIAIDSDGRFLFEFHDSILLSPDSFSIERDPFTHPVHVYDGVEPETSE